MTRHYVRTRHDTTDGSGQVWDINGDGSISDGQDDAFDTGMDLSGLSSLSYLVSDGNGVYETLPQVTFAGILLQRQIYVSDSAGFARFHDTVTNVSDNTQTFAYRLDSDFGADGSIVVATSSGDSLVATDDAWVAVQDSTDATTPVGILFGNKGDLSPAELSLSFDDLDYEYDLSLAPGESAAILTFAVQGPTSTDVTDTLDSLLGLSLGALDGLSGAQLQNIINWDLDDPSLDLTGTDEDDQLFGGDVDDTLRLLAGDDLAEGGAGNDEIFGGLGSDTIFGGAGNDVIYGDGSKKPVTTSAVQTLTDGQQIAVSLTADDAARGDKTKLSGFISRQEVTSDNIDLMFAIDVSGSTNDAFVGSVVVGDPNGDGRANTILDAEIASFESLHASIVEDANLPNAAITILPFESSATLSATFSATQDDDGNGIADVVEYVRSLTADGGTDFESALAQSTSYFRTSNAGQKVLYFLSDGGNNEGGAITDDVATLLDLGVQLQSYGVGSGANENDLDIVDDNLANGSTTIVLDPSGLADELLDPGIEGNDIASLTVFLNGVAAASIAPNDLTVTPFGLRYFELELDGMNVDRDDAVEVRAISGDGTSTVISTTQVIEHLTAKDDANFLAGGSGDDILVGGASNDVLMGGSGADELRGSSGRDLASYADATNGVTADLSGGVLRGDANGDQYFSVEGLIGSSYGDMLTGDRKANIMRGLDGRDALFGLGGKDILHGGKGNDSLTGGKGNDRFIFKQGGGRDTIEDYRVKGKAEKIDLRDFEIASFGNLQDLMQTQNGDAQIMFETGDTLILSGVILDDLKGNDFLL